MTTNTFSGEFSIFYGNSSYFWPWALAHAVQGIALCYQHFVCHLLKLKNLPSCLLCYEKLNFLFQNNTQEWQRHVWLKIPIFLWEFILLLTNSQGTALLSFTFCEPFTQIVLQNLLFQNNTQEWQWHVWGRVFNFSGRESEFIFLSFTAVQRIHFVYRSLKL